MDCGKRHQTADDAVKAAKDAAARLDLRASDIELLRQLWDRGKASGLAGEVDVVSLVADEKSKRAESTRLVRP